PRSTPIKSSAASAVYKRPPMHKQPVFSKYPSYINGISESLFHRGLCLPSGPYVTDRDADRVIEAIKSLII
ncbi:MAG: DegT/DnrJ/EryC1/StrS family aminotransferase, partial [Muribaculaceae bacterium]|nr:DegT/DnrJ/EryC1/StrS family aminotransferase [Muribaculaceae bacterium]